MSFKTVAQPAVERAYTREIWDVRERAAEALAAIGPVKLGVVARFRANRWCEASTADYEHDQHLSDIYWVRAVEWWRIATALPAPEQS